MSIPEGELQIFRGRIILETSKGMVRSQVTPEGIQITTGTEELFEESLRSLTMLPVSFRPPFKYGLHPTTVRAYEERCLKEPVFRAIAERYGANPEATYLTNSLYRNHIRSIERLLSLSEEEVRALKWISRFPSRVNKILALNESLRQEREQHPQQEDAFTPRI